MKNDENRELKTENGKPKTFIVLCLFFCLALSSCQTGFYLQAVRGHTDLRKRERPVAEVIADKKTPVNVKTKLEMAQRMCAFAERELKLPADGQYARYADLERPFVVWNVFATPEFSLEPKTWWYPFIGHAAYRGYFAQKDAEECARKLREKGNDVQVGGIEVYSTLGFFRDPLLNTFIQHSEPVFAETIFHELAHQRVFASGDSDFNEAFATAVGQEGARQWLRAQGKTTLLQHYDKKLARHDEVLRLFKNARIKLAALYGDTIMPDGKIKASTKKRAMSDTEMRAKKKSVLDELRSEHARLQAGWGIQGAYIKLLDDEMNNAQLSSIATYYDLVPAFDRLLAKQGGDWNKFYSAVEQLAKLPRVERHARLTKLQDSR